MQTKYIIGLGSPLLDMQAEVPMEFLTKYDLSLNNTFFAEPKHMPLYEELLTQPNFSKVPGGASLNTLRMAQWMAQGTPEQARFVGCVGEDHFATMLKDVTLMDNVNPVFDINTEQPTGKCAVLLHQNDRCLVPLIGAAGYLSDSFVDQNLEQFKGASILFSEVYFLYPKAQLMNHVFELCASIGVRTCLTLSSVNAIQDKLEEIRTLFQWVDVVFCNEDEIKQMGVSFGLDDEDLSKIAQNVAALPKSHNTHNRVVVVTRGSHTTLVASVDFIEEQNIYFEQGIRYPVEAIEKSKIVDTNAAGDSFSGGFISQLLNGASYRQCVLGGHYVASQCIQHAGSSIPNYKPSFSC